MKIYFGYEVDGKEVTNYCDFREVVPSINPTDRKIHCYGSALRDWIAYLDNEDAVDIILEVDHPYENRTGRLMVVVEVDNEGDDDRRVYEVRFEEDEIEALIKFGMIDRYEARHVG